jgi:hypothetical protein
MIAVGERVEVLPRDTGAGTGVGARGVVIAVYACDSSVTGVRLCWTYVDIRLDSGALVTREPHELRR